MEHKPLCLKSQRICRVIKVICIPALGPLYSCVTFRVSGRSNRALKSFTYSHFVSFYQPGPSRVPVFPELVALQASSCGSVHCESLAQLCNPKRVSISLAKSQSDTA